MGPLVLAGIAAAAAVAGALLSVVVLRRPDDLAPVAFGLLFSNACVLAVDLHGYPPAVAMLPYALLLLPALVALVVQRRPMVWGPVMTAMVLFGAAATLSTALAPDPAGAVGTLVQWLLEGVIFVFAALNCLRDRRALRRAVTGVGIGALVVAVAVVRQYRQQNYYDVLWGFAQVSDPYDLTGASSPLADGTETGTFRAAGMLGEPNFFALAMLTVLPWLVYLAWTSRSLLLRAFWALGSVGVGFAVLLSYSRGALVAAVGVVALLAVLGVLPRRVLLVLAGAAAVALWQVPSLSDRVATLHTLSVQGATGEASLSGRLSEVRTAGEVFLAHPATGVGPGQFPEYYQRYVGLRGVGVHFGEGPRNAHNLIAGIAADLGTVGLLVFGGLVVVVLTGLRRARRTALRPEATAALTSVALYLGCSVFLHLAYARYLWLLVALAATVIVLARRDSGPDPQQPQPDRVLSRGSAP